MKPATAVRRAAAVAGCLLIGASACAQSSNVQAPEGAAGDAANGAKPLTPLPLWELGLGVGVTRLPYYRGADQSKTWVLPLPYVAYRGDFFKADREGARAELLKSRDWRFDFSVAAGAPASSSDDRARQGMRDLPATLEFGPNLAWTMARGAGWKLEARAPLRAAMTLERSPELIGAVLAPHLNLDVVLRGWDVGVYVGPLFATRKQNAFYYDVPDAQALPERPAYRSRGGYAGSQIVFGSSRRIGDTWFGVFGKYDQLRGAVFDDSPLLRRKSNFSIGFGVSWILWKSVRPAPAPDAPR